MKYLWNKIRGRIMPIPDQVKNIALIVLLALMIALVCLFVKNNEYDKILALLGIFAAICSSNIFNVRAEIEKYQLTLSLEKRRDACAKIITSLCELQDSIVKIVRLWAEEGEISSGSSLYLQEEKKAFAYCESLFAQFRVVYFENYLYYDNAFKKHVQSILKLKKKILEECISGYSEQAYEQLIITSNQIHRTLDQMENIAKTQLSIEI